MNEKNEKKHIKFNDKVIVNFIPSKNEENRSTNLKQLAHLMHLTDLATIRIAGIINSCSRYKILFRENDELPMKIVSSNPSVGWYDDMSAIYLYEMLVSPNEEIKKKFMDEYNKIIGNFIVPNKICKMIYKSENFFIFIMIDNLYDSGGL